MMRRSTFAHSLSPTTKVSRICGYSSFPGIALSRCEVSKNKPLLLNTSSCFTLHSSSLSTTTSFTGTTGTFLFSSLRHCSSTSSGPPRGTTGGQDSSSGRGAPIDEQPLVMTPLNTAQVAPGSIDQTSGPGIGGSEDPDSSPAKPERSFVDSSGGVSDTGSSGRQQQQQIISDFGNLYQSNDQFKMMHESGRPKNLAVRSWKESTMMLGMPAGYPQSVRPGYRRFFHLAAVAACVAAFSAQIGTQSLLSGFFKGSSAGSWILKDLAPTLISAGLANAITSYGTKAKMWYIVAMGGSQLANIIEFCIPHLLEADHFLMAATVTSLVKGSSGLVFGITRATFIQHYAWNHNIGEVTKKTVSIGMVVWTVFGALGLAFAKAFPDPSVQLAVVLAGAVFCTGLTYHNVSHIAFANLTPVTNRLLMDDFLMSCVSANEKNKKNVAAPKVAKPEDLAEELGIYGEPAKERLLDYTSLIAVNPSLSNLELKEEDGSSTLWKRRLDELSRSMRELDEDEYWAVDEEEDNDEGLTGEKVGEGSAATGEGSGSTRSKVWPTTRRTEDRDLPFILGCYKVHPSRGDFMGLLDSLPGDIGLKISPKKAPKYKLVVIFEKDAELLDVLQAMLIASHIAKTQKPANAGEKQGEITQAIADEFNKMLDEETTIARLKYWRRRAVLLVSLLEERGWDIHSQSIDPRSKRFSFSGSSPSKHI